MEEKRFNLIDEPWILAVDMQGETVELSLLETITKAHELKALSGEIATVDISVLRLLLGVLYAVYLRTDEYINIRDDDEPDPAAARELWKELWERGRFDADLVTEYLRGYHDRFWLIHPERPFYQVAELNIGSPFATAKLIGDLAESANKNQLFAMYGDIAKQYASYPVAARWLVNLMSFADNAGKPKSKGVDGKGVKGDGSAWLGHIGLIWAVGNNLFETLMLNLSFHDRNETAWESGEAAWELEVPRTAERTEIQIPKSPEELLTLQSRRVLLYTSDEKVTGYIELGGDRFAHEKAFTEQMTAWYRKKEEDDYRPKKHDSTKQLWRAVTPLISKTESTDIPGTLMWLEHLASDGIISAYRIQIDALSVEYGAQSCGIKDVWSDSISINANLLGKFKDTWIPRITELLGLTEKMANQVGFLAADIACATGDRDGNSKNANAKTEAYFRLDAPFRSWLASINPQTDDIDKISLKWIDMAKTIILNFGKEIVSQAGAKAFIGRETVNNKKIVRYTAPEAYRKFRGTIKKYIAGYVKEGVTE